DQFETYMTSAVNLSAVARTATLPLHKGMDSQGRPVYFIITDASDCDTAKALKVNYAPKLGFLIDSNGNPVNKSAQKVAVTGDLVNDAAHANVMFQGTADFTPIRTFIPGFTGWPPIASTPGSSGDINYTPYITFQNQAGKNVVLNASQVANWTGVKDYIPQIDFDNMTVTFNLVMGIYNFNYTLYLRMDASDSVISGFEGGIYARNPEGAPTNGKRFYADKTARQTIMPVVNGAVGVDKIYDRQGLQSASLGEGDPLNVLGAKPGELEYSPIWDVTPVVWTQAAISAGRRQRLRQDDEVHNFVASGDLVSYYPAMGAFNDDIGVTSLGVVSNCPVMLRIITGELPYKP
ncbi:MAG: hypothetical protein KGN84_01085, partial [Acidobacteriota bacterium]|nr:hypothetical protein [Acidobacteriota bacterium]